MGENIDKQKHIASEVNRPKTIPAFLVSSRYVTRHSLHSGWPQPWKTWKTWKTQGI